MNTYKTFTTARRAVLNSGFELPYIITALENGRFVPLFFTGGGEDATAMVVRVAHAGFAATAGCLPMGLDCESAMYAGV